MSESEKRFDTDEVVINYFEGPPSGPPLVMLHGMTVRHQMNLEILAPFMPAWQVFAPDLRGHGASGRTPAHYHLTDYARDMCVLLRKRVGQPAVLMGASLGALTCLEVVRQAPECVQALLLIEPPLYLRDQPAAACIAVSEYLKFVLELKASSSSFEELVTSVRATQPPGTPEEFIQELSADIYQFDPDTVNTCLEDHLLDGWILESVFPKINVPTLLFYGDWDHGGVIRAEDAAYFQAHLPQCVNVQVPDGSHFFPWEQTEMTVGQIQSFLATIGNTGGQHAGR